MNDIVSFGEWVKRRRKWLDLTQKELAERVGCSPVAITKIERDERRPSRQVAYQAGVLSYALEALMGLAGLNLQAGAPRLVLEAALFALHHPASPGEVRQQALDLQGSAEKQLAAGEAKAIRECLEAQIEAQGIEALERKFFADPVCSSSAISSTSPS